MFSCKACLCKVVVGFFDPEQTAYCEKCFNEIFPGCSPTLMRKPQGVVAPILSSSSSSSSATQSPTIRFRCCFCSESVYSVLFSCDCEAQIVCHDCVSKVTLFSCSDCNGSLEHNPSLQMVMMRTVMTKCLSCDKSVRVGSMEAHVKKNCKGSSMVLDERVFLVTKMMEVEKQRYYDGYAKKKTRKT